MIRWATTFVLTALLLGASPAHAGTIVFDFEDGLQGWELFGSAQRVQTQLLGGEWAIFGDGFLDQLVDGPRSFTSISFLDGTSGIDLQNVGTVTLEVLMLAADPEALNGPQLLRGFSSVDMMFVERVSIRWSLIPFSIPSVPPVLRLDGRVVAFIDNITFHTIPEPGVLGMLVMGGIAALATRRARRGSA